MATAKKAAAPVNSEKAENFIRIGGRRVHNVLTGMRSLKNLANKASYEYTDAQVAKIMTALTEELASVEQAFEAGGQGKTKGGFQL